jgi:hypothetical protein
MVSTIAGNQLGVSVHWSLQRKEIFSMMGCGESFLPTFEEPSIHRLPPARASENYILPVLKITHLACNIPFSAEFYPP